MFLLLLLHRYRRGDPSLQCRKIRTPLAASENNSPGHAMLKLAKSL
jgi:hypothetical protein